MYFDTSYLVLVLPTLIFAFWAQANVNGTFNKFSKQMSRMNITGAQVAQRILQQNGIYDIRLELTQGKLSDHFDPGAKVIRLSPDVYNSTSLAAIGVAAHEVGHAIQYAQHYTPIKIRNAIIPLSRFGSTLAMPLAIIGLIFSFSFLVDLGILFFFFAVLFQAITLPVEFNASKRAMKALESGNILDNSELPKARKTLNAAALTYVAALAVSLGQFIRLILISNRRN